jgi:Fe-S-cluster containining protein
MTMPATPLSSPPADARLAPLLTSYGNVVGLACGDCPGDCCVSPTLTAPEFVHMMRQALLRFGESQLLALLSAPTREHLAYPGNHHCRFQDSSSGRCINYEGRGLACRLHGHEVLRQFHIPDMEYCARLPAPDRPFPKEEVEGMIDAIQQVRESFGCDYSAPYFLTALNLECWLDLYFHLELTRERPTLAPLGEMLRREVLLPQPAILRDWTTLRGKLNAIDRLTELLDAGDALAIEAQLLSLLNDYPSVGSLFLAEGNEMLKFVQERIADLLEEQGAS